MSNSKDLDKFYTHPDVAKKFVSIINQNFPLDKLDLLQDRFYAVCQQIRKLATTIFFHFSEEKS